MKIVLSSNKLEVIFLSLMNSKNDSFNYTVMLNGHSQWLNVGGGGGFL